MEDLTSFKGLLFRGRFPSGSTAVRDLAVVAVVVPVSTIALVSADFLDWFFEITRSHEEWELDEFFTALVPMSVVLAWYALRRWREVVTANEMLEGVRHDLVDAQRIARVGSWRLGLDGAADGLWSEEMYRLLGVSPARTVPEWETIAGSIHPEDRDAVEAAFLRLAAGEGGFARDFRVRRPGGGYRDVHAEGRLHCDGQGRPQWIEGTLQDISDRKTYERETLRLKERIEGILMAADEGILGLDAEGRITFCNPAAARLTGWDSDEVVGRPKAEVLLHSDLRDTASNPGDCPFLSGIDDGQVQLGLDEIFWRKDGTCFPAEYASSAIEENGKPTGAVVVFRDISQRIIMERILAEKAQALADSNAELQNFAYVISHDLREPLRMVSSYVRLLEKSQGDKLDEDARDYIHFAVDGAKRMSAMISDLVEFSRIETTGREPEPVDSADAIGNALDNLRLRIADSGVKVSTPDSPPKVLGDETQLVRLFQNLVENAIKYHHPDRPPEVRIEAKKRDGEAIFSVTDNGLGIEEKDQAQIFGIFRRLHGRDEFEGTGIGLAVVKRIVERHGGRVWVHSEPGVGSTFSFTLRMAPAVSRTADIVA